MDTGFLPRIGTFFVLISVVFQVLFIGSYWSGTPEYAYCIVSLPTLILSFALRRRAGPTPSDRFLILRGLRERREKKKEK